MMIDRDMYVLSLPLVKTATLPLGRIFFAQQNLYEVIEVDLAGYSKARKWRKDETTDVALIPKSNLAMRLPVVDQGYLLPVFQRQDLLDDNVAQAFIFPSEQNAIDAAYLDVALCGRDAGVYLRRADRFPAFEVTNGLVVLRHYYYMRTRQGLDTNMPSIKHRIQTKLIPHREGAPYWQLLDSWDNSPYYDTNETIAMRSINIPHRQEPTARHNTIQESEAEQTLIRRPKKKDD